MKIKIKHKDIVQYYSWLKWSVDTFGHGKYRTDIVATLDSTFKLSYEVRSDE